MNRFSKRLGIYLPAFILFFTVCVTLRSIACFSDLDYTRGYFNNKVLITIADSLTVAGAVFLFTHTIVAKKANLVPSFSSPATYVPAGMISAALIFLSAHLAQVFKRNNAVLSLRALLKSHVNVLLIFTASLALLCTINFLLTVLITKKESIYRAAFGILMIVFLCAYSAYLYFDTKLPLNAPCKTTDEMAFLFSAIFFCYETRLSLGREKWRPYTAFGLISALLTAYSSIPTLLVYFFKGVMISDSLTGTLLTLTLCIYITSRTVLVGFLQKDETSKTVEAIIGYHDQRKEDLKLPSYARSIKNTDNANVGLNYRMDIPLPAEKASDDESALAEGEGIDGN